MVEMNNPPVIPTSFVGGTDSNPSTVANILATYPASATFLGKYARVNDLYGSADEVMRCSSDGSTYYWRPQRTDYAVNNAATGGTVNLTPLVSAPQQVFTATLLGNMTVNLQNTNAWPGAQFELKMTGVLGIFGISIAGLVGGGTLPLLTGGSRTLIYTAAGWREIS